MVSGTIKDWPKNYTLACGGCNRNMKESRQYFQALGVLFGPWWWCCLDCARERGFLW
jgi:hypothetical protein